MPLANAEAIPHSRQLDTGRLQARQQSAVTQTSTRALILRTRQLVPQKHVRSCTETNDRSGWPQPRGKKSTPRHIRKVRRQAALLQTSALIVVTPYNPGSCRYLLVLGTGTGTNQLPNPNDAPTMTLPISLTTGHSSSVIPKAALPDSFSNNVGRSPPTPAREPASTPPAVTAHPRTPLDASNHPSPEVLSRHHPTETADAESHPTPTGHAEEPGPTPDRKGCRDATPRSQQHHQPTTTPQGNRLASAPRRISPTTASKTRSFPPTHAANHETLHGRPPTRLASEPAMATADSPPALKLDCKKFGVTLPLYVDC